MTMIMLEDGDDDGRVRQVTKKAWDNRDFSGGCALGVRQAWLGHGSGHPPPDEFGPVEFAGNQDPFARGLLKKEYPAWLERVGE